MKMELRIAFVVTLLAAATPARAFAPVKSNGGATLHWSTPVVRVAIDPGAPSQTLSADAVAKALAGAAAAWSDGQLAIVVDPAAENVVRFHIDGWSYDDRMLAYTELYAHPISGEITSGVIDVDERDHDFAVAGEARAYDLQAVLSHELGHLLGLGHSLDQQATMFAGTAPGDLHQRVLNADDRAGEAMLESFQLPDPIAPAAAAGCSVAPGTRARASLAGLFFLALLLVSVARRHSARGPISSAKGERSAADSIDGGMNMNRTALILVAAWASGCASTAHLVVHDRGAHLAAVAVAPVEFSFALDRVTGYQKTNEVVEAIRQSGRLAVDPAESPDGAPVARLRAHVDRTVVDEQIDCGPPSGVMQPRMRFHFISYQVRMELVGADGRAIASGTLDAEEDFDTAAHAKIADHQPALTRGLRELAARLMDAVSIARRSLPTGLAYLDTHRRLLRIANHADDVAKYSLLSYFFPDLAPAWFGRILDSSMGDGVLITRAPAEWETRAAFPGDLLLAVDGKRINAAATADRLLSREGAHELELEREGRIVRVIVGIGEVSVAAR